MTDTFGESKVSAVSTDSFNLVKMFSDIVSNSKQKVVLKSNVKSLFRTLPPEL